MQDWWDENGPPVYITVAMALEWTKGRKKGKRGPGPTGDLGDLLREFPGGVI